MTKEVWSRESSELLAELKTNPQRLTSTEASQRLTGSGHQQPPRSSSLLLLLLTESKSPIILILIFSASLSFYPRDSVDALIILAIVALVLLVLAGIMAFYVAAAEIAKAIFYKKVTP